MTNMPIFPEHGSGEDNTSFPLFIAKRFNFPLAYHERGDETYYAIQDWVRGLTEKPDLNSPLASMKGWHIYDSILARTLLLDYVTRNNKRYKIPFTIAENLILIMYSLRDLQNRQIIPEVKRLFVERLSAIKTTSSYTPVRTLFDYDIDQLDLDIEDWGSNEIIHRRISREELLFYDRYCRNNFFRRHILDHFVGRMQEIIKPHYYDLITDDIYKGVWKRSPQTLKLQMGATSLHSVRMLMPSPGFEYHMLVEAITIQKLSGVENLSWHELRYTIKTVASMVGGFAKQVSLYLGEDIATGRPLLKHG